MINYWWVTRPKRKLNSVPEVLASFADLSLNQAWEGQRDSHLAVEVALEEAGLKRKGERRDQTGGGARTYKAWLVSLGLIFIQESTGQIKLTLAGEALMNGESPVEVLKNQVLKYQFPSAFSLGRGVQVNTRFKIHPFWFMLKLLDDNRINYLTEEEIAKIIVTEAEEESEKCFEYIVKRICDFRTYGDSVLSDDFFEKYKPSKGNVNVTNPFGHLIDLANTFLNWLEYTQLAKREEGRIYILDDRKEDVKQILMKKPKFVDRPKEHEYFQRKYGLDLKHKKDNRNLAMTKTITARMIDVQKIRKAFIALSLRRPIRDINHEVVDYIVENTGADGKFVERTLIEFYPNGAIGGFMTEYFEMAFKGTEDAVRFEIATTELFKEVFGYNAIHLGQTESKSAPDVLLLSDSEGYQAIIDNKAYSRYSISRDHHNRMVHNYIENVSNYSDFSQPIGFFSYIAGGFGSQIDKQIESIADESGIHGSGITVSNMIKLVEKQSDKQLSHKTIRRLFSLDRQIVLADVAGL